jgi:hypothetical protein
MKRLVFLLMTFLLAMSVMSAQTQKKAEMVPLKKLKGTGVSDMSKDSFYADFGNMPNVTWKRIENFDEATFTKDGKEMKAFYDIDSKLVGTTHYVPYSEVPERAQKEIKSRYKDYKVDKVIFFDDSEANETDMLLYGTQFSDEDNYFIEMLKGTKRIVLQVNSQGELFFFKDLK